jgi:hypothetical protein
VLDHSRQYSYKDFSISYSPPRSLAVSIDHLLNWVSVNYHQANRKISNSQHIHKYSHNLTKQANYTHTHTPQSLSPAIPKLKMEPKLSELELQIKPKNLPTRTGIHKTRESFRSKFKSESCLNDFSEWFFFPSFRLLSHEGELLSKVTHQKMRMDDELLQHIRSSPREHIYVNEKFQDTYEIKEKLGEVYIYINDHCVINKYLGHFRCCHEVCPQEWYTGICGESRENQRGGALAEGETIFSIFMVEA